MGQVCDERKVNDERGYHVRVEFFSTHSFFLARKNVFFSRYQVQNAWKTVSYFFRGGKTRRFRVGLRIGQSHNGVR